MHLFIQYKNIPFFIQEYPLLVLIPLSLDNALLCLFFMAFVLKSILSDVSVCYSLSLVISICMKYLFPSPRFQSVFHSDMNLLQAAVLLKILLSF